MTFANPILWAGVFALGIPVLIHLMTRSTPVIHMFPTLRFLQRARANQSRLFRIRHWLMLALRTAAILLILLAFLRPEYRAGALVESPQEGAGHVVVVLVDTSLSMQYTGQGFSPLARARVAAENILANLGADDVANVIFVNAQPRPVFDEPLSGTTALIEAVELESSVQARGDADAALALALKQIEPFADRVREIHVVSDFQRTNWAAANFGAVPEDVKLVFVSVAEGIGANTAVTEALVAPAYPALGEPVQLQVRVANYSDQPRQIPVTVMFAGEELPQQQVSVSPGATATRQFRLNVSGVGAFEGRVTIPEDALTADNTRYFTADVAERTPVTILSTPQTIQSMPSRLLQTALDPLGGVQTVFEPRVLAPGAFDAVAAGAARIVIVSDVQPFSKTTAEQLVEFVQTGGGLVYFLGNPADAVNLNLLAEIANEDLKLPFSVGRYITDEPPTSLHQANYDHPILRKFRETGALASLHFYRYFETTRNEAQGQILLRYANNQIALASTTLGAGGVLLANFSADPDASDLPKHPVFVPLLHEMTHSMRPQIGAGRACFAGRPCTTSVQLPSPDVALSFTNPAGEEMSAGLSVSESEAAIVFGDTGAPGFYRVHDGDQQLASVAVNVDACESDLAALTVEQLEEVAQRARDRFYAQAGVDIGALQRLRDGLPLWHYFLIAALAALALEQAAAWWWKR